MRKRHTIIGADPFHGPVRDGKAWFQAAVAANVATGERFQFLRLGECAYVFCGGSGHGFKFGPLIGERIAAVLTGRAGYEETAAWLAGE